MENPDNLDLKWQKYCDQQSNYIPFYCTIFSCVLMDDLPDKYVGLDYLPLNIHSITIIMYITRPMKCTLYNIPAAITIMKIKENMHIHAPPTLLKFNDHFNYTYYNNIPFLCNTIIKCVIKI